MFLYLSVLILRKQVMKIETRQRYLIVALLLLIPAVGATEILERRSVQEDLGNLVETPTGLCHIEATVEAMYDGVPVPPTTPLQGAIVRAVKVFSNPWNPTVYSCFTNSMGKCSMSVPPSLYIVTASKNGFTSVSVKLLSAQPWTDVQLYFLLVENEESDSTSNQLSNSQSTGSQSSSSTQSSSSSQSSTGSQSTAGGQSSSLI